MLSWATIVAFHGRTFGRFVGTYHPVFGQDIDRRASEYLEKLSELSTPLRFEITLQNIKHEADLLIEEAALTPNGLELQAKLFELADKYATAREILYGMFKYSLFPGILRNIVTDAKAKATQTAYIRYGDQVSVTFDTAGVLTEVAAFPSDLWPTIRGHLMRAQKVGLTKMEAYYMFKEQLEQHLLPDRADIEWHGDDTAVIRIG